MMYNTPKINLDRLREGTVSKDNRAKAQNVMQAYLDAQVELERVCKEKGIPVPKIVC